MPQLIVGTDGYPSLRKGNIATWERSTTITCIAGVDLSFGLGVKLGTQATSGDGLAYPTVTLPDAGGDKLFGVVQSNPQMEGEVISAGSLLIVCIEGVIQVFTHATVTTMSPAELIHTAVADQMVGDFGGTNTLTCTNAFWRQGGTGYLPLQITPLGN